VLIAIDTADEYIGLAAYGERGLLAEEAWLVGQNHSVELLPGLERLLRKLRTDVRAIRAVGVSLGPGSFNGIRVGVSTAKALAYGLGAALIGVLQNAMVIVGVPAFWQQVVIGATIIAAVLIDRLRLRLLAP